MSLSLDREANVAPFIRLRPESLAASEAQPPMQVIRRNGTVSKFDASKISVAMTKAFLAVEGHGAAASRRVHEIVEQLTSDVVGALSRRMSEGRTFHIEDVQDQVELALMRSELGNDWTRVRGLGAHIKGTNGESQGVVPFLKVANDTAIAVNQGGKRKGAVCAYLETWHIDIEEFLDLRKNTGDDRRRTHDMNTASWVPDLFMQRVEADGEWTLFSPDETPTPFNTSSKAWGWTRASCSTCIARCHRLPTKQPGRSSTRSISTIRISGPARRKPTRRSCAISSPSTSYSKACDSIRASRRSSRSAAATRWSASPSSTSTSCAMSPFT